MNVYCGGSAANNADGNILAPPKLAKNRYGREEMLALFTGPATVAPAELKTTFPEFYIEQQQEPICMMPFTDVEEVGAFYVDSLLQVETRLTLLSVLSFSVS